MMVSEASYALIHFLNKKQELREGGEGEDGRFKTTK